MVRVEERMTDHSWRKQEREKRIERIADLLRGDHSLTNVQLMERGFRSGQIEEARQRTGVRPPQSVLLTREEMDGAA